MALRSADILYKDQLAGSLTETVAGGSRFTYASAWNEDIACCFPAVRREHEWVRGLHPFFEHLAPEGWLREQQARAAHVIKEDDLGLLLRYGADCIGAVSLRPNGNFPDVPEITESIASPGRTISGIQKKLLVVQDGNGFRPAATQGLAPFIAKFNSERINTLVRNEALSLRWTAAVLGADEVTKFQLAHVSLVEEPALIVTRFDRGIRGEKLRLEDCAQILCKPRGQDYAGKYDAAYEDIASIIKRYSVRPQIDLLRFFRRLLVFTLVGNCDAHLKNFSLLETPIGLRLSPAYDVLNIALYEGFDQTLALTLAGRKINLDAVNNALFRRFGLEIGLPQRAIDQVFADLRRLTQKAESIIAPPSGEGPDGFVTRFAEIVTNTCRRILE
jgi:serine/threonine-protein kinase HipA